MTRSMRALDREDDRKSRTGGTRKAQASRRREQLLEAALALFSERGYRGTSVRDITRRAGVTEAVLYHYFANKLDLWSTVLATYAPFSRVGEILTEVAAAPVEQALRTLGTGLLQLLRARETLVLALLSEAPAASEVATVFTPFLQGVADEIAAFLSRKQAAGEIAADADVRAAARAFQGALLVRFLAAGLGHKSAAADADKEEVARLVGFLMRGLAPTGAA